MIKKIFILFFFIHIFNLYEIKSQIISKESEYLKCDTAKTNLDYALCTRVIADSLNNRINTKYNFIVNKIDSAITQNSENLDESKDTIYIRFSKQQIKYYKNIKNELIKSQNLFFQYVNNEIKLTGVIIDKGKERIIYENLREIELLNRRLTYLNKIIYNFFD